MKLLKQSEPNCLLYSFAMVLNVDPKELIDEIGHNGQEVWWPNRNKPYNLRGYHIQEMIDCCWRRGYAVTPISAMPALGVLESVQRVWDEKDALNRFESYLNGKKGVLIGSSFAHACAWDGEKVFDPNGIIYDLSLFQVKEIWIVSESNHL